MEGLERILKELVAVQLWVMCLYAFSGLCLGTGLGLMIHVVRILAKELRRIEKE